MIKIKKLVLSASVTSCLALSGVATTAIAASENPNDWPQYHRTSDAWRFSPLDQINVNNIDKLKVAWIHQPGDVQMGLQATPIVSHITSVQTIMFMH